MNKKTVIVLTLDEVKDAVIKHFVNFYVSSPVHLANLLREGKFHDELPNFKNMTTQQLVTLYKENGVVLSLNLVDVNFVVVRVDNSKLEVLFENKE